MPHRDIRSDFLPQNAFPVATISTDTTTAGAILDTADFDSGVMFVVFCTAYTDGTYTPLIHDGDNSALSDAAVVVDAELNGTEAAAALTALSASGADLLSIGYVGSKRYVRFSWVSTSTSSGADLGVLALKKGEIQASNA